MFSTLNMSGAFDQGLVPLALCVVRGFSACDGEGVVLGLRSASARYSGSFSGGNAAGARVEEGSAARGLAALLAEREADGQRDVAVVLELHGAGDLHWLAEAISWLASHGRRTIVRTDRALPRDAVEAARDAGAIVQLRIASFDPRIQAALLGPQADTAARLLLGAQHLRAQSVGVGVLLAPLMPVVHSDEVLESLTRNICAADVSDLAFAVGGWSVARHQALAPLLPPGGATALARAYGVFEPESAVGRLRLGLREATLLERQARRIAEHAGLKPRSVAGCGCDACCEVERDSAAAPPEPFRSLLAPDLFGSVGSPATLADVG